MLDAATFHGRTLRHAGCRLLAFTPAQCIASQHHGIRASATLLMLLLLRCRALR